MKKMIGIGIAAMMVMGLATIANAQEASAKWTLQLRAGVWTGTAWSSSTGLASIGIDATGQNPTYATPAGNQAAFFGKDPDPTKSCNKDIRKAGSDRYVWNFQLVTGATYAPGAANTTVAWWIPSDTVIPTGWTIEAFRNGDLVKSYVDDGIYSSSTGVKSIASLPLAAGVTENWQIVATSVPEPGSMVAMFSGLVGLVGFGIRRRK